MRSEFLTLQWVGQCGTSAAIINKKSKPSRCNISLRYCDECGAKAKQPTSFLKIMIFINILVLGNKAYSFKL